MKKTLVALAALAATGAFAQSSVTISGVLDAGLNYTSAPATNAAAWAIGRQNNNRVIFSGVEDLGGGLKATFAAQMRFEPNTGNPESNGRPLFQGETTVGLSGGFGSLKVGRWLPAVQLYNGGLIDPWGVTTVAGQIYVAGYATDYNPGGEGRTEGIFYSSPSFGGIQGHLTFSPRTINVGGTNYSKSFLSAAATYINGPVAAMLGWEQNRAGDQYTVIGGNYNMGVAKIHAGIYQSKGGSTADRAGTAFAAPAAGLNGCASTNTKRVAALGANAAVGNNCALGANETINGYTIGAAIPMGASTIRVGYSSYASDLAGQDRDSKFGLGLNYALSKRTSVYTDIASFTRNNNLTSTNAALDNGNVTQFDIGIAHSF